MLKANKRILIITSTVTLLPVLTGIICWNRLPPVMATGYGMNNEPDGFCSKAFAVFGLPAVLLIVLWLGALVLSRDSKKKNVSPKMFYLALWIVSAISLFVAAPMYPLNLGYDPDIPFFSGLLTGLAFIIIGSCLPKAGQNDAAGIRVPSRLENEENRNRARRLAGYLWMICGTLMILIGLTRIAPARWLFGIFLIAVLVPGLSFCALYAKERGTGSV